MKFFTFSIILFFALSYTNAQKLQMEKTKILIVVDASYSMLENWDSRTKIDALRVSVNSFVDKCAKYPEIEIALRYFGSESATYEKNCEDSKLEIPFSPQNFNLIKTRLNRTNPKGISALAYALKNTEKDFEGEEYNHNYILIFADGTDACNSNVCRIYEQLLSNEIATDICMFGLGMEADIITNFSCFKKYVNTTSEANLKNELTKLFEKIKPY
jgi:Ca-activated chloride channel homolog